MSQYIQETYLISADNSDVLKTPSRLSSIPYGGKLTVEVSASALTSANQLKLTVVTPDGDIPLDGVMIPAGSAGALDTRTETVYTFVVEQGNHFVLKFDVTGSVVGICRVTLNW